ncbi:transglutaminase domain-containing protein [Mobilitalea sibirica]|uniref:Transglutaminase domain-containing protein n=1 Tax=Mobilitalea sibirica TaxID=1462919 RepID=A0A8J7KW17_9FIRM|nr:transglutaminase domain-containing protein [Mobilitalea sibirica]MBH1939807.1 transglutaminase domain-containing protein [Mobilitalea sibirica]
MRKTKRVMQGLLILLSICLLIVAAGVIYQEFKPMVVKAVTMEAGSPMASVKEFLLDKKNNGSFITELNELDLNRPGEYEIRIKVKNKIHTSSLEVIDTTAPKATVVNQMALKGDEIKADAFVTDVVDATEVKIYFKEEPDVTNPGAQEVGIVLEDTSQNITELKAMLTVLDVKNNIQVEAGSLINIIPADFINEGNYNVTFLSDLTKLDTSKPTVHEIQMEVNGRVLTSNIEVIDTTPPIGKTVDLEIWKDEKVEAYSFMSQINDVSTVNISYKETPDFTHLGTQEVTILLTDEYQNISEVTANLMIKEDTQAPVFTGIRDKTVYEGETVSYKKGINVSDNKDKDISYKVDSSKVNLKKPGTYQVTYSATDSSGNKAIETATITVNEFIVTEEMVFDLADSILAKITNNNMTKLEKAWEIFRWVKGHVGYTGSSDKSSWLKEAYRGMSKGLGDCFTYYAVAEALLTRAGIDNMRVTRVGGRTQHFWNLVNYGEGWYHFDTCPTKDKFRAFMLTDAEVEAYTKSRGNKYYNFDKSLYPATPDEKVNWP